MSGDQIDNIFQNGSPSVTAIHNACAQLCRHFGFSQFLYIIKTVQSNTPKVFITHGSKEPLDARHQHGVCRFSSSSSQHIESLEALIESLAIDIQQDIMSVISENLPGLSIRSTLSLPIKDTQGNQSLLFLGSRVDTQTPQLNQVELTRANEFANKIHHAANELIGHSKSNSTPQVKLTKRELECLQWAADGKTNSEISTILGVSRRTVIFHLQNAAGKLNTSNRYHTVAQAISSGLIKPRDTLPFPSAND